MKRIIIAVILAVACNHAMAQDWSKFGLKGKILRASIETSGLDRNNGTLTFSENGTIQKMYLETPWIVYTPENFSPVKNGYAGQTEYNTFDATVKQGRIVSTKIVETDRQGIKNNYNTSYTYGSNGFLEKMSGSRNWTTTRTEYVERKDKIDDNGVQAILTKLNAAKKAGNSAEVKRLTAEYQKAISGAKVQTSGGNTREIKENHSQNFSRTYYNYKTDELGNWTSRTMRDEDGKTYTQTQTIVYEPEFLSGYQWDQLLQEGNLDAIEAFAQRDATTKTYRQKAADYWNGHILTEVATKQNNDLEKYLAAAYSPIAVKDTKDKALDYVQTSIYNQQVLPERDYAKVEKLADKKWNNNLVFDSNYRTRIKERATQLRADSLAGIQRLMQTSFDAQDYQQTVNEAKRMLAIDAANEYALKLKSEAGHRQLLAMEQSKTINDVAYTQFIQENPTSEYLEEVCDKRALLVSETQGNKFTWNSKVLPVFDEKVRQKVQSRSDHARFVRRRGKFMRVGFGIDGTMGLGHTTFGGGINARFGYFCSWVNLEVGAKYNYMTSTKALFGRNADLTGGFLEKQYISVPVDLHIHLSHDWDYAIYLGLGAELGVAKLTSNLREKYPQKDNTKDKKIANEDMTISPKLSFGYTTKAVELEAFLLYDMDSPFNEDYLKANYSTLCDEDIFKQQVTDPKIMDKLRLGIALRFLF